MDYTTLPTVPLAESTTALRDLAGGPSLYEALQDLPDPRRGQGKRYELALLLCLLVLAKLAGQTTLSGATEWIRHRAQTIATHFGLKWACLTFPEARMLEIISCAARRRPGSGS